jgi:hypothetical protein
VDNFEQSGSEKLETLEPSALSTELTRVFLQRPDIHVDLVERSKVMELFAEGTLAQQYEGHVKPEVVSRLQLQKAQYIVFCKYYGIKDRFHIEARIVKVEDGTQVAAIPLGFRKDDDHALEDLAYQLRKELLKHLNLPVPTSRYRLTVCSVQTILSESQADDGWVKLTAQLVTYSITQGLSSARMEDVDKITQESSDCSQSGGAREAASTLSAVWVVEKVMVTGQGDNRMLHVYVWIQNSSQERLAAAPVHICGFGELSEHMNQIADELRERWATRLAQQ